VEPPVLRVTHALFPGITAIVLAGVALDRARRFRDVRAACRSPSACSDRVFVRPGLPGYATLHTHLPLLAGLRNAARWAGWFGIHLGARRLRRGPHRARVARAGGGGAVRVRSWAAVSIAIGVVPPPRPSAPRRLYAIHARRPHLRSARAEPGVVLAEFPFYSKTRFSRNGKYLLKQQRERSPRSSTATAALSRPRSANGPRTLASFPSIEALSALKALGVTPRDRARGRVRGSPCRNAWRRWRCAPSSSW